MDANHQRGDDDEPTARKICQNCQKYIAVASFVTHEVHCTRNTVLCPQCMQPVLKAEVEEHVADVHTRVNCPCCHTTATRREIREFHRLSHCTQCNQEIAACVLEQHVVEKHSHTTCPRCLKVMKKIDLDQHQSVLCEKRIIACKYCDLQCSAIDHDEHEDYCGTRTELCTNCEQYIMVREMKDHVSSNCRWPAVAKTDPQRVSRWVPNHGDQFDSIDDFHDLCLNDYRVPQYEPPYYRRMGDVHVPGRGSSSSSSDDGHRVDSENSLPCEFCGRLFDVENLMLHQFNECYNAKQQLAAFAPNCLPESKPQQVSDKHEATEAGSRPSSDTIRDDRVAGPVIPNIDDERKPRKEDDEVNIACEFCLEIFDKYSIREHEGICYSEQLQQLEILMSTNKPSDLSDADQYRYPYAVMTLEQRESFSRFNN